jgi:CRISPR-associated endonuclease/helicase Cas3
MRVLVEQTRDVVGGWIDRLGLADQVMVTSLLGGEPRTSPWRMRPDADMVIVGTLDMIVSRALNRGYGESRFIWPIDFGLFNNDCHFVFDEVQLMGPALATSRQLHGLRRALGTSVGCTSMWMSATIPEHALGTVDAPTIGTRLELPETDRLGALAGRMGARKRFVEVEMSGEYSAAAIAQSVLEQHRPGRLTIAVVNTVDRARELIGQIERRSTGVELVFLHSRFRSGDRATAVRRALAPIDAGGPGRVIVSTQVIEAGVDMSADVLFTEAAVWPSIVQRAGRCNRDGRSLDATILWAEPPKPLPYEPPDVAATVAQLRELEGQALTAAELGALAVPVIPELHAVLRRRDVLELFDTLPDLSGNDVDVSRFIRVSDDLDVSVAWRMIGADGPDAASGLPGRNERCPVPVAQFRKLVRDGTEAWRYDHIGGGWTKASSGDVRPGAVFVLPATSGGYTPERGWDAKARATVDPIVDEPAADDRAMADDPASRTDGAWVSLRQHLTETRAEAERLVAALDLDRSSGVAEAIVKASAVHDIGKAHPVFDQAIWAAAATGDRELPDRSEVPFLAKSGGSGPLRYERKYFRHELASALALLGEGAVALESVTEADLVVYLVAAHHGRVRMGIRSMPDESDRALGIEHGDVLPMLRLDDGEIPVSNLDLSAMMLGERNGRRSWSARALTLRDRDDLGPFVLGYAEALVRIADWSASALHQSARAGAR